MKLRERKRVESGSEEVQASQRSSGCQHNVHVIGLIDEAKACYCSPHAVKCHFA